MLLSGETKAVSALSRFVAVDSCRFSMSLSSVLPRSNEFYPHPRLPSNAVIQNERATLVRPYPLSLEWPVHWLRTTPAPEECRASVIAELGLNADVLLGVGVDRLDYTKGVEERFLAVERLLEQHPEYQGRFTFVQLAAPSRILIERYRQLNESVEQMAARVNERFAQGSYRPIILHRAHHEPPTVFRYYRAADLCYVSSLHDGMNLVAKEFVAAREDERGVLVLSQFTGAARELTEALIVNPTTLMRPARRWPRHSVCRLTSRGSGCVRCVLFSRSSTYTAGPDACWWMLRVCAAENG